MARFNSSVEIDKKSLERWNVLRSSSDAKVIAELAQVTEQTVYNAFNRGKCQQYLLDVMAAYYEEKYEALQQTISDYYD